MRPATLLLSALIFATTAVPLQAQKLAGRWFKMTVTAAGTGFNQQSAKAEAGQLKKIVRYAFFGIGAVEGVVPTYSVSVYSPTTEGGWTPGYDGTVSMLDIDETYVLTATINMPTVPISEMEGGPNFAAITFNGPCKLKLKGDDLKGAKITSLGATSYFTNDTFAFYGKAKLTLTMVDEADLPFVVVFAATKPQPAPKQVEPKTEAKADEKAEAKPEAKREEQPAKP